MEYPAECSVSQATPAEHCYERVGCTARRELHMCQRENNKQQIASDEREHTTHTAISLASSRIIVCIHNTQSLEPVGPVIFLVAE